MLLIPVPLPDEIARGYLGRIAQLNGADDEEQAVLMLRRYVGSDAASRREHAVIELLASASRSDLIAFLLHHTLLPYRSFISDKPDRDASWRTSRSVLWSQGMKVFRTASYFCPRCMEEDISLHGQSYWRRQHQLPGMLVCAKHGSGLCYVESNKALLKPPSHFINSAFKVCDEWVQEVTTNPLYQRFFEIWISLAECDRPIYAGAASRVFRERARTLGFATRPGQKLPLLSDRVVKSFGERWLATISPSLATKSVGVEFLPIDRHILAKNVKTLAHYYVLIAAQLFDATEDALFSLVATSQPDQGRSAGAKRNNVSDENLVEEYVRAKGRYSKSVRAVGMSYGATAMRLKGLGLPALNKAALRSLHAFFVEQRQLDECAEVGGLSIEQLAELLRQTGAPFAKVIKRITSLPSESGPGSRGQRPKALNPHELGAPGTGIQLKFATQKKYVRRHLGQDIIQDED